MSFTKDSPEVTETAAALMPVVITAYNDGIQEAIMFIRHTMTQIDSRPVTEQTVHYKEFCQALLPKLESFKMPVK